MQVTFKKVAHFDLCPCCPCCLCCRIFALIIVISFVLSTLGAYYCMLGAYYSVSHGSREFQHWNPVLRNIENSWRNQQKKTLKNYAKKILVNLKIKIKSILRWQEYFLIKLYFRLKYQPISKMHCQKYCKFSEILTKNVNSCFSKFFCQLLRKFSIFLKTGFYSWPSLKSIKKLMMNIEAHMGENGRK